MMPTFPRSPLSFRTAGFPRYGCKADISDGAFPDIASLNLLPAYTGKASALRALRATSLIPHCVGPSARSRTVVEVGSTTRAREGVTRNVGLQTIKAAIEKAVMQRGSYPLARQSMGLSVMLPPVNRML